MDRGYSSVLLRWHPAFKQVGPRSYIQDYSAAFFMIDRLIEAGASYVVTDNELFTTREALERIPEIVSKRLMIVNSDESRQITSALMKPVLDELGMEEDRAMHILRGTAGGGGLNDDAMTVFFRLPDFLLACREQLQIDFPLDEMRTALDQLLGLLRSPQARANISTLAGIFASYRPAAVESLEMRSGMSAEASDQVAVLFEDELYKKMSAAGWLMGIPLQVDRACVVFGRCARRVAGSRLFKPIVNIGSKLINASTHVPVPDSEIGALIAQRGFMPPMIALGSARDKAYEDYLKAKPPLFHPKTEP